MGNEAMHSQFIGEIIILTFNNSCKAAIKTKLSKIIKFHKINNFASPNIYFTESIV